MANSLSFNSGDLSTYGLKVLNFDIPSFSQQNESQLIQDISYGFTPKRPAKIITVEVGITGADRSTLDGYLDSIKRILATETAQELAIDAVSGRYWLARLENILGLYNGPDYWGGSITFRCNDPMAYDNSETSSDHNIDADPDTVVEAVGGTGIVLPVYTLAAGEDLTDVTIKVENLTTDEELQWTGSLSNGEELEIDVAQWIVNKEGSASMATVTGQFPRLAPNINNSIKVTGFSTTGTLNITYRKRYL